jgi:N-acetylglutamate synthase-like GNAT family acetyltransferase
MSREISFRPVGPEDSAFLFELYASTRREELVRNGWSPAQQAEFLKLQFAARQSHYQDRYPNATFQLILREGKPAGCFHIDRRPEEIYVVDLALLPHYRDGTGRTVLRGLLAEAARAGLPVMGHVEILNPALRLFQRLGFVIVEGAGPHYRVRWEAGATQ